MGIRVDSHIYNGYSIPPFYDSMMAKLIVHADTRNEAIIRLSRALDEFTIKGPQSTIPLGRDMMNNSTFKNNKYDISFFDTFFKEWTAVQHV
jgi:acetyl-CoA carboxylase, biotin carboxylase subunit